VKSKVSYRIRKLRESKDFSQENMAAELNITSSAYSKIERGITDPSISRMEQIAKILGVDVTYFFLDTNEPIKVEDGTKLYGFATKSDIEELNNIIKQLKQEIATLKKDIAVLNSNAAKRKK
jgi:transcriptional regulator with XRE-family HTH domain